jgi:hypothetical protein
MHPVISEESEIEGGRESESENVCVCERERERERERGEKRDDQGWGHERKED